MSIRVLLCSFLSALIALPASAQVGNVYLQDSSIRVNHNGQRRNMAWAGGFNAPQFVNADLNKDGLQDLVAYEWRERTVRTFINRGTPTAADYRYDPRYAVSFPYCNDYVKMPDYNRDGVPDHVTRGISGFAVYRGYYNTKNELNFTFYKDLRYQSPTYGDVNAYTQASDIPGIADVDGDGDIDFFGFDVQGGIVGFYKNCQVEQGRPKDSIIVCNPSNCWGHIYQSFSRSYTLGIVPSLGSFTCTTRGNFGCKGCPAPDQAKTARHSGNCMLVFDYDGDGDMDLLDGNISFPDLQLLINGRAQYGGVDSMISQDTLWQSGGHRLTLPNWPSPNLADWDGDGKQDLVITPHDFSSENYRCVHVYRNTGTATAPAYTFTTDTGFIDQSIDMGSASIPVLYDFNKDGRLDLFVGSDGFYQPDGTLRSRISYYQNSRSGNVTTLNLTNSDFMGLFAENIAGAAPGFGDLNGDGIDDLVIGHTDGTLTFYTNTAVSNNVAPKWVKDQNVMRAANGDTIDVGYSAAPFIYDIDKDGKPDLLIGNQTGRVVYYKNGSTGGLNLSLANNRLGDVKADQSNTFSGFSTVWIGKMDVTGSEYMVLGNDLGNVVRYTGFQNGNVAGNYTLLTEQYSGIKTGIRSAVTIGDIDGDGAQEMIIGNSLGGLYMYKRGPVVSVAQAAATAGSELEISPNPARNEVLVTWKSDSYPGPATLSIYNAVGQELRRERVNGNSGASRIDLHGLTAGMYICRLQGAGNSISKKLTIIE